MTKEELVQLIREEVKTAINEIQNLDEKYKSAGSVGPQHKKYAPLDGSEAGSRHKIGKKLLGAKGKDKKKLAKAIAKYRSKHNIPSSKLHDKSIIWAFASAQAGKKK